MISLKQQIQTLKLDRTYLERLLNRGGAPKPIRTDPKDWRPEDIERYLTNWSGTLECKVHLSGKLHRYHYAPKEYLVASKIAKRLGFKSEAGLAGLISNQGMPAPEQCEHYFGDIVIATEVWQKAGWEKWFERYRSEQTPIKIPAKPTASPKDYPKISREWIHGLAEQHGRRLTHTITVGFKSKYGRDDDLSVVQRINENEKSEAGKLAWKLPVKVWRKFERVKVVPKDRFFFCVWPESHSRFGVVTRWHFHVELFLNPLEARFMQKHWSKIELEIHKRIEDFADGRDISALFEEVDAGYINYSSKDAFNNLDMIQCNFMPKCTK